MIDLLKGSTLKMLCDGKQRVINYFKRNAHGILFDIIKKEFNYSKEQLRGKSSSHEINRCQLAMILILQEVGGKNSRVSEIMGRNPSIVKSTLYRSKIKNSVEYKRIKELFYNYIVK